MMDRVRGCVYGAWRLLIERGLVPPESEFDERLGVELEACYLALDDKKPGKGWELPERVASAWQNAREVS